MAFRFFFMGPFNHCVTGILELRSSRPGSRLSAIAVADFAAANGNVSILRAFEFARADINFVGGQFQRSPFTIASVHGLVDAVRYLIDLIPIDQVSNDSALDGAFYQGHEGLSFRMRGGGVLGKMCHPWRNLLLPPPLTKKGVE